jgi:DNA-binding NarL/FixJ family response regulator
MPVKVFLVEGRDIVRQGVKAILDKRTEVEVVGEARNATEAFEKIEPLQPDVILIDTSIQIARGLEFTHKVKKEYPEIKVIVLTLQDYESNLIELIEGGADGYILHNTSENALVLALRKIANKDKEQNPEDGLNLSHGPSYNLSDREKQVLDLIAQGLTNTEMAKKLFTSVRTIETRRKNLLTKTGTVNTATLIRFAVLNGLIK